jgi:hypothetical protein
MVVVDAVAILPTLLCFLSIQGIPIVAATNSIVAAITRWAFPTLTAALA